MEGVRHTTAERARRTRYRAASWAYRAPSTSPGRRSASVASTPAKSCGCSSRRPHWRARRPGRHRRRTTTQHHRRQPLPSQTSDPTVAAPPT